MSFVLKNTFYNKSQIKSLDKKVVVLLGRSNVGKSSLINSLSNRKALARISKSAGKTLSLNCYLVDDSFYLVDFPGYGYARQSHETLELVQKLCNYYLETQDVKLAYVLIDSRHPLQENDKQVIQYLESLEIPINIIVTKTDKLKSNNELNKRKAQLQKELTSQYPVIFHSSKKKMGNEKILKNIREYI